MIHKFSIRQRAKSFTYAWQGVLDFFAGQHNAIIHAVATIAVVMCGYIFNLSQGEWIGIVFAISIVWMAEIFNTAIEKLCDVVSPQRNENIRLVKDLSAAAVLISALAAITTASIIFIPKIV